MLTHAHVYSQEAEERGLSVSLYGRLVKLGVQPFFLDTQFRSHPKIMEFCAKAIYEGRLKTGIDASMRKPLQGFEWPRLAVPVAFVETGGGGSGEEKDGDSKLNRYEAQRVLEVLEEVLNAGELKVQEVRSPSTWTKTRCTHTCTRTHT